MRKQRVFKKKNSSPKNFLYKRQDKAVHDSKQVFKITSFYVVLDQEVKSLEDRFTSSRKLAQLFGFLVKFKTA